MSSRKDQAGSGSPCRVRDHARDRVRFRGRRNLDGALGLQADLFLLDAEVLLRESQLFAPRRGRGSSNGYRMSIAALTTT